MVSVVLTRNEGHDNDNFARANSAEDGVDQGFRWNYDTASTLNMLGDGG